MDFKRLFNLSLALNFILCMCVIIGAIILSDVSSDVERGQLQRQSFNAETRFQHCARVGINDPAKEKDMEKMCAGYDTLEESYESERNR